MDRCMDRLILAGFRAVRFSVVTVSFLSLLGAQTRQAQPDAADWPMYNRDLAGTRFSPLRQIDASNVGMLKQVWSYNLGQASANEAGSEFTPIVIKGVLYLDTFHSVMALDAETGQEIWRYELKEDTPSKRGVAYWPGDKSNPPRIIFTSGSKMIALNAGTGRSIPALATKARWS